MTMNYYRYPGPGVSIYPTASSLPLSALDGQTAITTDTDILYAFDAATLTWKIIGGSGSVVGIGTIDSETKSANGGVINASDQLIFQTADATFPGLVSATTQTIAGSKTFTSQLLAGSSSLQVPGLFFRDANAGDSTNVVDLQVGNKNANQGATRLRFQNAAVTSSPNLLLSLVPRKNDDSTDYTAASLSFIKQAATDATNVILSAHDGSALNTVLTIVGSTKAATFAGALAVTGATTLNGNVTLGDAAADSLTVSATITSNLVFTDATYDIGASGATRPRNLFLSGNAVVGGTFQIDGTVTFNGSVVLGDSTSDTLSGSARIAMDWTPSSTNTRDLGTTALRWKDLWLAGNATVAGTATISGALSASNVSGTNTGDVTLGAVGAVPNANAASLSGQVLTLQPADGSFPGVVTTAAQTIAGIKSFSASMGIGGANNTSAVINIGATNPLTGTDQRGTSLGSFLINSSATVLGRGYSGVFGTAASSFTCPIVSGVYINISAGAASTITRATAFSGNAFFSNVGAGTTSNRALLSDNESYSGSYGINLTTTSANLLTGPTAIGGTTTNDSAASGFVGEYIESLVTSFTNWTGSTGQFGDLASISLTAGDWDVTGSFTLTNNAAVLAGYSKIAISINTGNTTTDQVLGVNELQGLVTSTGVDRCAVVPVYRKSLSGTTTIYLKGAITTITSGTPQYQCRLSARRVR
jgi:hypothetical protein